MSTASQLLRRVVALKDKADAAASRLEKAAARGKRIPGDGDGDGIAYENRNRGKGGGPARSMGLADAIAAYPKAGQRIARMKEGQKLWVTTGTGATDFAQLQRAGDKVNVLQENVRPGFMPKPASEKPFTPSKPDPAWKPGTPNFDTWQREDLARRHAAQTKA